MPQGPVTERIYTYHSVPKEAGLRGSELTKAIDDYIPWSWRGVVCTCDHPTEQHRPKDFERCGACNLYRRWHFRKCTRRGCGKNFLFLFVHHNMNHPDQYYWCYDCRVAVGGELPGDRRWDDLSAFRVPDPNVRLDFDFDLGL